MANLGGQGSQLGETGDPGLGQRTFLEAGPQSIQIDGCRGDQMLQMCLANPQERLWRRPKLLTPWEMVPSTPARAL